MSLIIKSLCRLRFRITWDGLGCFRLLDVRVLCARFCERRPRVGVGRQTAGVVVSHDARLATRDALDVLRASRHKRWLASWLETDDDAATPSPCFV